ncbi:MAG: efflux RND transporter periplasmic adaptor subunit [Bacteroidota bacterium]
MSVLFSPRGHRLLSLAVFLLAATGCGDESADQAEVLRPVRYAAAVTGNSEQTRTFAGVAQAGTQVQLSARVGSTIETVAVEVGASVRRGQTLARLDATDYVIQQRQAEAAVAQAVAQLRNAEAAYDRTQELYANQAAALGDLDAARAQFESAGAQVRSSEAQADAARRQVGFTRLTAPVSGSVASVLVEPGEQVGVGQTAFVLTGGGQPEVQVAVPEGLIGRIRSGASATVRIGALGGEAFVGTVAEIGVAATSNATTFPVNVRLTGDASAVRPGMAAEVTLAFRQAAASGDRVIVPLEAVAEDRSGRYVFVLERQSDSEAVAQRRAVETGQFAAEGVEILTGVQDGTLVATAGVSVLADGQRVALLGAAD